VIFNAHHESTTFVLPTRRFGRRWQVEVSTTDGEDDASTEPRATREGEQVPARGEVVAEARSLLVLKRMQ
jgi:pullulanase/glycogen debranching enzyme